MKGIFFKKAVDIKYVWSIVCSTSSSYSKAVKNTIVQQFLDADGTKYPENLVVGKWCSQYNVAKMGMYFLCVRQNAGLLSGKNDACEIFCPDS